MAFMAVSLYEVHADKFMNGHGFVTFFRTHLELQRRYYRGGQLKTLSANANWISQSFGQLSSALKHSQSSAPNSSAPLF